MTLKVWIHVTTDDGNREPQRVVWYVGTSDLMVEHAIRMHLHLPHDARFLLRDTDGDLVPVSATLPHDHVYQLVVVDTDISNGTRTLDPDLQSPRRKRRRDDQSVTISHDASRDAGTGPAPQSPPRARSMIYLITRFLETFTCAIPNDDNINFIPNTGPYALFALYCHLFPDPAYHPKSPNTFYKMTSMQGKIDRQRVIRYYRGLESRNVERTNQENAYEYVVYKPEGKGPLLRKYVEIGTDVTMADLTRAVAFVQGLNLDPHVVVAQYTRFLEGFIPISKADYQTHTQVST